MPNGTYGGVRGELNFPYSILDSVVYESIFIIYERIFNYTNKERKLKQ